MRKSIVVRVLAVVLASWFGLTVVGCSSKPDGKYSDASGVMSVEFKSGKATVTALGNSEVCDYTVDGDKVTVTSKSAPGGALIFTIMKDGSLQCEGKTLTKNAG